MTRYKCVVSYIGKNYNGWQSQTNGLSIQEEIEKVLEEVAHQKIHITASGRTDAGVNARGQVFMFDSNMDMTGRKWMGALNGYLSDDIHVISCTEVTHLFHARYNVRYKKYTYRINTGPYDVFTNMHTYQCPIPLDFEAMKECAKIFEGTHDFTSFNSAPLSLYPDQTRTIFSVEMQQRKNEIEMSFTGKGFLRYMVRMMSAAIIDVGKHKLSKDDVQKMLDSKDKHIPRRNAEAEGLTLEYVDYFELYALDKETQIREYLFGDVFPYPEWTLDDLELRVRRKNSIRAYAFCMRNTQEMMGYLYMNHKNKMLVILKEEYKDLAETLIRQNEQLENCQIELIANIEMPF